MNYFAESMAQIAPLFLRSGILPGLSDSRVAFVSRQDLADATVGVLIGEGHEGVIYNATGPTTVSSRERAALISFAADKPLRFEVMDEDSLRTVYSQAGIPPEYVESVVDIERQFANGSFDIVTGDVKRLAGRNPQSLQAVLVSALKEIATV